MNWELNSNFQSLSDNGKISSNIKKFGHLKAKVTRGHFLFCCCCCLLVFVCLVGWFCFVETDFLCSFQTCPGTSSCRLGWPQT